MNAIPVITRELREQARQPFTYWLRMCGVAALLVCGYFFTFDQRLTPNRGAALFGYMHMTLLGAVWILVPLGTADCLSRERREGTLGLLFLTPLTARDIVVAKGLTHGLRGLTLLLAALPVLTIPFLLGGVGWPQALASALANFSGLCWALAAALVASAFSKNGLRAMALAMLLAAAALFAHCFGTGLISGWSIPARFRPYSGHFDLEFNLLLGAVANGFHPRGDIIWSAGIPIVTASRLLAANAQAAGVALLALAAAVRFAAWRVRRSWQEEPPSVRAQQMDRVFLQPIIGVSLLRRWMRWKLERNPIGWLEQRRWSGRLVTWSWLAVITSVQTTASTNQSFHYTFQTWELVMAWLLVLSMAASAAGSFRRERETGVLELLLVSPLRTGQIIGGRLRGLWGQFLPSIALLLGAWLYLQTVLRPWNHGDAPIWYFAVSYFVLPVVGLYYSVSCRHFISAFLLTLGAVLALPAALMAAIRFVWWLWTGGQTAFELAGLGDAGLMATQLLLAGVFGVRLHRRLTSRSFPLDRGVA